MFYCYLVTERTEKDFVKQKVGKVLSFKDDGQIRKIGVEIKFTTFSDSNILPSF